MESINKNNNGNNKINSTSKIKKIIEIKKNRNEKGKRAFKKGENPHSNGLIFSLSKFILFPTKIPKKKIIILKSILNNNNIIII